MNQPFALRNFRAPLLSIPLAALAFSLIARPQLAHAIVSRPILKTFFQTGDKPTQAQFATLIDSVLQANLDYGNTAAEHGIALDHGRIAVDASGQVRVFGPGDTIDNLDNFGGLGDNIVFNPIATAGTQDVATGGEFQLSDGTHFGFLQLRMDPPGSPTPYAIHLNYFVYEETPGVGITTFFQSIPEPSTCLLALAGAIAFAATRRRRGK
jgi:hypothetical protein